MQITDKFLAFFEKHRVNKNQKFLLACSGGVDSMVLFHLLLMHNFKFEVAHCNFKLRGADADTDEAFVQSQCAANNRSVYCKSFDTEGFAEQNGISIQMAARQLRYAFFDALITEHGFDFLFTAHHLNDSFETFLINVGRGTGPKGLSGISAVTQKIARPLHRVKQEEISAYAKKNTIAWREDASNASVKYQRNAIRHKVLPQLLKSATGYISGFQNTLENVKAATIFAESKAKEFFEQHLETTASNWLMVSTEKFQQQIGLRYLLHFWLSPFNLVDVDAMEAAIKNPSAQYFESAHHALLVTAQNVILKEKGVVWPKVLIRETDANVMFGHFSFSFKQILNPDKAALIEPKKAFLDYEKLTFPLTLRTWKKGDLFTPFGMRGTKKISDFFTDLKLNRFEKEEVPLLISGDDIVWVAGYRINENYKITDPQKTAYFGRLLN